MLEQTNNIDLMFSEIKNQIIEQVTASQKAVQSQLSEENKTLKKINTKLLDATKKLEKEQENFKAMNFLVERFKNRIKLLDTEKRDKAIYSFLDIFFERDFTENTYECPLWLGCVTQYYNNREAIIDILRILDVYIPENIETFRLPHEWTTEEIDIVFETMSKHIVCNNELFGNNLRFWKPFALDSVYDVCHNCTYSEIPWQFLLRNPNLLDVKYLSKIGAMAFDVPYVSGWRTLFNIEHYQDLTEEHIKIIIDNINPFHVIKSASRYTSVYNFLLSHLEHVTTKSLLDSIYTAYSDSYDFKYKNCLIKMPYEYSVKWMKEHKDFEWLKRNKSNFNNEQLKELILTAMEE